MVAVSDHERKYLEPLFFHILLYHVHLYFFFVFVPSTFFCALDVNHY